VEEVPLPERTLLAVDDEQRFAGKNEEALLIFFGVVPAARLAGLENADVDSELREPNGSFEARVRPELAAVELARLADVEHEPALALRHEARA
jgi:hypothetical protein